MRRFLLASTLVGVMVVSSGFFGWTQVQAAPEVGSLIKLVSDNNSATTVDAAVYYLADNGKRYVFPNEATYRTWYTDFLNVQEVTATELASLPIGGNVTYRPGTRLVKITTDPKVYVVEPAGVLRHLPDEVMAQTLFGANWMARVDDVPDAFFVNYSVGAALGVGEIPAGSLVRRLTDGAMFVTEAGTRKSVGVNELAAARLVTSNALVLSDVAVNGLADGGALSLVAAIALSQPVVTVVSPAPTPEPVPVTTPTLSVRSLPAKYSAYVRGTRGAELARFGFSVTGPEAFNLSAITVQGFVNQQEAGSVFFRAEDGSNGELVRLRDLVDGVSLVNVANGQVLVGASGLSEDGRLVMSGFNVRILPGASEVVLALVGDVDQDVDLRVNPDRIAFDIENGLVDIVAKNDAGALIPVANVVSPNHGTQPLNFVEIRWYGTIEFSWAGAVSNAQRGNETLLGELRVTGLLDGFNLQALAFRDGVEALAAFDNFRLVYLDGAGVERSALGARNNDLITFNGLGAFLPQNQTRLLKLYGTPSMGASAGGQVKMVFEPLVGLFLEPMTFATNVDLPSVGNGAVKVLLNSVSNVTVQ